MALKSFPYPVLGNGDDISGKFAFSLFYTLEPERVLLDGSFELEHATLESLIRDDKARFATEIVCPATFYREVFDSHTSTFSRSIPAANLRGVVTVSSFICAKDSIRDYDPAAVHPDLEGDPMDLEAGEILAIGEVASFIAEKNFDPLRSPVSSFMRIQKGNARTGPMTVDYDEDKIVILLSREDHAAYASLPRKRVAGILHASVVLPVLTDTMHLMGTNKGVYQDLQWYARLEQICAERGLSMDEPFESAQKVLGFPLARNFRSIKELVEVE